MLKVGLVGSSGVGKTALAERLIPRLSARGLRVAYLKHAHAGFQADGQDSDSWRVRNAGALTVGVIGPAGFLLEGEARHEADALLARMPGADLALLEGWSAAPWPKVVVRSPAIPERDTAPPVLMAIQSDPPGAFRRSDLDDLVDRLSSLALEVTDPEVALSVDGRAVSLGRFPTSMIAGTVEGMLSALRDVQDPGEVELRIRYPRGR